MWFARYQCVITRAISLLDPRPNYEPNQSNVNDYGKLIVCQLLTKLDISLCSSENVRNQLNSQNLIVKQNGKQVELLIDEVNCESPPVNLDAGT